MPISDLCQKKLISVQRNATLQQAARLMKTENVGGLVVLDDENSKRPVGILTDRDIVLQVVADGEPLSRRVSEIMSPGVTCVEDSAGVAEVIEAMERDGVRRIIITDASGKACGLVSSDDILQLLAHEISGLGHVVQKQVGPLGLGNLL